MNKVIDEFEVGKYKVLKLSEEIPNKRYYAYLIDGKKYSIVQMYDMDMCISIEGKGNFKGKTVEFVK